MIQKFKLGRMATTPGVLHTYTPEYMADCVKRHATGDWGDLDDEDKQANEEALVNGERIFSHYENAEGDRLYIITEWDRSVTTLLLPEEY